MKNRPEYIVVGLFGRPRGVSGEIFINVLSDNPERFRKPETFWLESDEGWTEIKIISIRYISGRPAAYVEGVTDSEQAKKLTNMYIYVRGAELGDAPEGSYYYFDLIGSEVINTAGTGLGKIVEIENYPANDVWVIESNEGKKHMFPAVRDYIKEVKTDKKLIIIDPPEGIFDSEDEN